MKEAIIGTLIRRALGYLGVAGVVGLENEIYQAAGVVMAAGTLVWSLWQKIKAAKS